MTSACFRTLMLALLLSVSLLTQAPAEARVPGVDPALGYGLDAVLTVAGKTGLAPTFRVATDPALLRRIQGAVAWIRTFSGYAFRYDSPRLVLITGAPGEPNALCTGPSFYVSRELVQSLTDAELIAVLAHEMAHAEAGHLTQRMGFPLAASLIQLGHIVATGGAALADENQITEVMDALEAGTLGQEMEADCLAYGWLRSMQRIGAPNRPKDLAAAIRNLLGLSAEALSEDPFMGPRFQAILSGQYADGCG